MRFQVNKKLWKGKYKRELGTHGRSCHHEIANEGLMHNSMAAKTWELLQHRLSFFHFLRITKSKLAEFLVLAFFPISSQVFLCLRVGLANSTILDQGTVHCKNSWQRWNIEKTMSRVKWRPNYVQKNKKLNRLQLLQVYGQQHLSERSEHCILFLWTHWIRDFLCST